MSYNFEVESGKTVKFPVKGKYCDRDIVVTATSGGSDFPGGYNEVDYIKFTGGQYVDTGIVCNQDTKVRILFTRDGDSSQYIYGVNNSGNTKAFTAYLGAEGANGSWRFGNQRVTKNVYTQKDIVVCAIVRKTSLAMSGNAPAAYSGVSDFTTIGSLVIGGCRFEDGVEVGTEFDGKIYSFRIWQGEELALSLIPVVSADGVYGFWDEVGHFFLTSATDILLNGGED